MARLRNAVFFQHECFTGMPRTAYCATFGSKQEHKNTQGFYCKTLILTKWLLLMVLVSSSGWPLQSAVTHFYLQNKKTIWKFYQMKQEKQSAATKGHCVLRGLYSWRNWCDHQRDHHSTAHTEAAKSQECYVYWQACGFWSVGNLNIRLLPTLRVNSNSSNKSETLQAPFGSSFSPFVLFISLKILLTHLDVERYSSASSRGAQLRWWVAGFDLFQNLRKPAGRKLLQGLTSTP